MSNANVNPTLRPKPQRATKRMQLQLAMASCMRLLLVIREALKASDPENAKSELYKSVNEHAQMCGQLIPNSMRVPMEELDKIKANSAIPADKTEPSRIIKAV